MQRVDPADDDASSPWVNTNSPDVRVNRDLLRRDDEEENKSAERRRAREREREAATNTNPMSMFGGLGQRSAT